MKYLERQEFLSVLYRTIEDSLSGADPQHPQDIMYSVLTTVEVVTSFVSNLPQGVYITRGKND